MSFEPRTPRPDEATSGAELALAFTQDAVHVLRRNEGRWRPLGQARFDDPAMRQVLSALRDDLGGEPLPVRVMIPDDQILYTDVAVDPALPRPQSLIAALEGLTPYDVADLAWDAAPTAETGKLRVAAVARQTLTEAEGFALAHGFVPQGFGALPGAGRFPHEPDFSADPTALDAPQDQALDD
ncbi:MAG: hypothetical protein P3W90_005440, partial [Paracoccus sp. (in: a-proteobacteria)]|nr:hypothetical protein [Paracoccus sp. (in: a-proteobacteria)]